MIKLLFISNIDKKHTPMLKINLKMQEDEVKICKWWLEKNDISFASPPPLIKFHFYSYIQNLTPPLYAQCHSFYCFTLDWGYESKGGSDH